MDEIKLNKRERDVMAQVRKGDWYSAYWTQKTWKSLKAKGLVINKPRAGGMYGEIVVLTEAGREWAARNPA